jgi:hypothetical protein
MTANTLGISVWNDFPVFSAGLPHVRVHLTRAGDGVVVDEDSGARYILGPPDWLDHTLMRATCDLSDDRSEAGPAAWEKAGMQGFRVARVPVDEGAGQARLRIEVEGRDPIRVTSRWAASKRPEPQAAPPKRPRRARKARS